MLNLAMKKLSVYSHLAQKKIKKTFRRFTGEPKVQVIKSYPSNDSHIVDDMPLTINRDPQPGNSIHQDHAI